MELVEGTVYIGCETPIGAEAFESVDGFVERLSTIGATHGVAVQAVDARYVADRAHLARAVELAARARDRAAAIADDPAMEVLLYAAGRRQIDDAMEMGLTAGSTPVVAVAAAEVCPGLAGDEAGAANAVRNLLEPTSTLMMGEDARLMEFFDISETELAATDADLAHLVRERVALLEIEK